MEDTDPEVSEASSLANRSTDPSGQKRIYIDLSHMVTRQMELFAAVDQKSQALEERAINVFTRLIDEVNFISKGTPCKSQTSNKRPAPLTSSVNKVIQNRAKRVSKKQHNAKTLFGSATKSRLLANKQSNDSKPNHSHLMTSDESVSVDKTKIAETTSDPPVSAPILEPRRITRATARTLKNGSNSTLTKPISTVSLATSSRMKTVQDTPKRVVQPKNEEDKQQKKVLLDSATKKAEVIRQNAIADKVHKLRSRDLEWQSKLERFKMMQAREEEKKRQELLQKEAAANSLKVLTPSKMNKPPVLPRSSGSRSRAKKGSAAKAKLSPAKLVFANKQSEAVDDVKNRKDPFIKPANAASKTKDSIGVLRNKLFKAPAKSKQELDDEERQKLVQLELQQQIRNNPNYVELMSELSLNSENLNKEEQDKVLTSFVHPNSPTSTFVALQSEFVNGPVEQANLLNSTVVRNSEPAESTTISTQAPPPSSNSVFNQTFQMPSSTLFMPSTSTATPSKECSNTPKMAQNKTITLIKDQASSMSSYALTPPPKPVEVSSIDISDFVDSSDESAMFKRNHASKPAATWARGAEFIKAIKYQFDPANIDRLTQEVFPFKPPLPVALEDMDLPVQNDRYKIRSSSVIWENFD